MTSYILFFTLFTASGWSGLTSSQQAALFYDKESCEAAAAQLVKAHQFSLVTPIATCVPR